MRAEDRQRALAIEHALMTGNITKAEDRFEAKKSINALRRYPVKPWLLQSQPSED